MVSACGSSPAQEDYPAKIAALRAAKDDSFKNDPDSPVPADKKAALIPLAYFPVDESYAVPATLDWDLWQGVAPPRSFVAGQFHPFNWRLWRAYGGGTLGDMGCHLLDPLFGGLGLEPPTAVLSLGPAHSTDAFADQAEVFSDIDRLIATGNVVFVSGTSRIAAERMEFNTRTKTGTFFTASGTVNMENRGIDASFFGGGDPAAYFYGETVEKLGPERYRISHGGFTTCVQPTPRWELVTGTTT